MGIVRSADIDRVDIVAFHQLTPVGFVRGIAPLFSERFDFFLVTTTDSLADRNVFSIEKVFELRVGVGVSATHEAVADESDADWFLGHKDKVRDLDD